mmetsp:Transcript_16249/g.28700  ORF Transcript_16249/g.28700 Transcript_16249/m.28700 type:complete len:209 (-) Transcript_16249:467-1093(-)
MSRGTSVSSFAPVASGHQTEHVHRVQVRGEAGLEALHQDAQPGTPDDAPLIGRAPCYTVVITIHNKGFILAAVILYYYNSSRFQCPLGFPKKIHIINISQVHYTPLRPNAVKTVSFRFVVLGPQAQVRAPPLAPRPDEPGRRLREPRALLHQVNKLKPCQQQIPHHTTNPSPHICHTVELKLWSYLDYFIQKFITISDIWFSKFWKSP